MVNHWHIDLQPTEDGANSDFLRWVTLTQTLALSCSLRKLGTGANGVELGQTS